MLTFIFYENTEHEFKCVLTFLQSADVSIGAEPGNELTLFVKSIVPVSITKTYEMHIPHTT